MKDKIELPFLIWLISISTMVACAAGASFLGYNIAGYAWAVPLFFAIIHFFFKIKKDTRFPIAIWLPWISLVTVYLIFSEAENAFQRSSMLLCPLFIGMTVSKYRIGDNELSSFRQLYRYMAISLCIIVLLKTGLLITGTLPEFSSLAAPVMTGALLCTLFATNYLFGQKRDIVWWAALATIPVIALTRMGMIATGLSLPLTFAPMKILYRIVLVAIIAAAAYGIFYTDRIQEKMFHSRIGMIADLSVENRNLATNGRKFIWERMQMEIGKQPWFGHGADASGQFVSQITGGRITHPHNDWLRLLYDYGYLGLVIFTISIALQVLHLLWKGKQFLGETRILHCAAASSFIPFLLFMYTDNIILYAAFFGNFQFTLLGLAYAADTPSGESESKRNQDGRLPLWRRVRL